VLLRDFSYFSSTEVFYEKSSLCLKINLVFHIIGTVDPGLQWKKILELDYDAMPITTTNVTESKSRESKYSIFLLFGKTEASALVSKQGMIERVILILIWKR
jgi:hypothetical protein